MTRGPFIATITGGVWYTFDPRVEDVRIDDFRALAYQNRYLGHAGCGYSPIQHMVHVAEWLEEESYAPIIVREGLGHDIHEYVPPGDLVAPSKRGNHPAAITLRAWEEQVATVVRTALDLPLEMSSAVGLADRVLLATEVRDLNPAWPGEIEWGALPAPWSRKIVAWEPERAWTAWLEMWTRLSGERRIAEGGAA